MIAAIDLHQSTGQPSYAADAVRLARDLIALQEQRLTNDRGVTGYYNRDRAGARRANEFHTSFADAPATAFTKLCAAFPGHADRVMWRAAVALESDCFLQRGAAETAPFHHVPTAVWKQADIEPYVARAVQQIGFAQAFGAPDIAPPPTEAGIRTNLAAELKGAVRLAEAEWLRTFPIAQDAVFHGAGTIQLARAPALVDAVPVGMDARHDVPFWPHTCYMTSREMWVVPAARMLALVAALHGTPQPGPAVSLRATPAGDDVRIGLAGTPAGRGDLRMPGHDIAFAAASRPRAGQPVWTGRPVDPSRAWVAQLETADGTFVADIVGGPGIRHDAATGS